ncbi:MAG: hypothetical protein ACD_49C00029G0007 [uncultured bacterium (gcode 4)]|uniref:Uncharacterized protein n=1 Tax=uncultured bacterium (gcode 4) TaxID=1234023 RepID=K2BWG0_9BACT|nr:MAG: hypothetical protein ACD_49C00029G0007 [uncultured bacterium (gcode 4)]
MNQFNYKETFFIEENLIQGKELIDDFNGLMEFYFDGLGGFKEELDSWFAEVYYRPSCTDLLRSSYWKELFYDNFSKEYDIKRLEKFISSKKFKEFLLDFWAYTKEYYLKKFLEKWLISEKYFRYLDNLLDNWEGLKELFFAINRGESAEKVIQKTPEEIKEKVKEMIWIILEEQPKKSYRLLNNLFLVIEKINNLLEWVNQLWTWFEIKAGNLLPELKSNWYVNYFDGIKLNKISKK